ncbi:hypothetical protein [Streptomyces sp. NPDC008121]|uniref:hypothetical protein n=1 Tax=Streptomyces sp. NPDC008121 TaxID=3364809 RepID=UPI0036E2456E
MTQEDPAQMPSPVTQRARLRSKVTEWWERQSVGVKGLVFSVIGGVAVFAVTNGLVPGVAALVRWISDNEKHGLSITGEQVVASDRDGWVFAKKTYENLSPAPTEVKRQDLARWAQENGGTAVSQGFTFTLGGKSDETVEITKLVPEVSCDRSVAGVHVYEETHLTLIPSNSTVPTADNDPPQILFRDEKGKPIQARKYLVSKKDKEEIILSVRANSHRCTWSVVVEWALGEDDDHKTRIPTKGHHVVTGTDSATAHWKTDGTPTPDYS